MFKKPSENPCRPENRIFSGHISAIFWHRTSGYAPKNEPYLPKKSEPFRLARGFQTVS